MALAKGSLSSCVCGCSKVRIRSLVHQIVYAGRATRLADLVRSKMERNPTPTFSSMKLKLVWHHNYSTSRWNLKSFAHNLCFMSIHFKRMMGQCVGEMTHILNEKSGVELDIYETFQGLTMDVFVLDPVSASSYGCSSALLRGPLARRDPSLNFEDLAVPSWVAIKFLNSVHSTRSGPKCPSCAHSIAKTPPTALDVLPWHSLRLWTRDSLDARRISSLFYQQIWYQLAALKKISIDAFIKILMASSTTESCKIWYHCLTDFKESISVQIWSSCGHYDIRSSEETSTYHLFITWAAKLIIPSFCYQIEFLKIF
jgi:hypothetical protein